MLISTWLQSFRNRLQPQSRRTSRRTTEQASRTLEHLESRHLLAAPQLIDVTDGGGRLIAEDDEIAFSPNSFVLDFSTTPDLDPSTLNSFVFERAGQDGAFDGIDVQIPIVTITPGVADPNEVVLTIGQPLPTDLYRITIPGSLANTDGETFNGGANDEFDFSIKLPSPSLVAVRPSPEEFLLVDPLFDENGNLIPANVPTLSEAPRELTLQFNPGQVLDGLTVNTDTIEVVRAGHDGEFSDTSVPVQIGYVGIGDVPEEIVIRFAENLPDDEYEIRLKGTGENPIASVSGEILNEGNDAFFPFKLDLGARIVAVDPQPVIRDANTGVLSQARDQIVLYFNNDNLDLASAQNTEFYQLLFTNDTVTNLDDNDTDGNPSTPQATINPTSAAYDEEEQTVTLTFASAIDQLVEAGTYRLRVGTNEAIPLSPVESTSATDPGDSFDHEDVANLGDLSVTASNAQLISSAIEPQPYSIQFPGANSEPGHREIEIETHLNGDADAIDGITKIDYNFQDFYGFTPTGDAPENLITEPQKQRAREIFEFYSVYLGIDFRETESSGFTIVTGDLRVLDPGVPTGPGGVTGIAGGGIAIMDQAEVWADTPGGSWFETAFHEIGHLLGLGHASELSPQTVLAGDGFGNTNFGAFNGFSEEVFPGDNDLIHGQFLHRPDSIDIDLYEFNVSTSGRFTAEVLAERLLDSSSLDSYLRLYRQDDDGNRTLIAQNDDYFSEDSYIELDLEAGTYFVGVSSTGNDNYDPTIPDTGFGGTSDGEYDLRLNFRPEITTASRILTDATGTAFDGDADGTPGGIYDFWFRATEVADTLFVDKDAADKDTAGRANDGSLASPYLEIDQALAAAEPGQTVRVVGNGGADEDILTLADNIAYEIGRDFNGAPLADGATLAVPQGVNLVVDAGSILKFRNQGISVGSTTTGVDNSASSIQLFGTPEQQVILTSWLDETVGTDTTPTPTTAGSGDWGGISIRNGVDEAEGRFSYRREGIFLNYINNATFEYGGGDVVIDGITQTVSPVDLTLAQPTITYNTIQFSRDSAISADPDSFEEVNFHDPRYQFGASRFTLDYGRVGPDIHWNTFVENSTNGIFVRVATEPGAPVQKLTVAGRFDDIDAVHVLAQNLAIQGTPGGALVDDTPPDEALVVLTPSNSAAGTLTPGSYNYRLVFVDANGFESPPSDITATTTLNVGTNTILVSGLPAAPEEYIGRRLYRSEDIGAGDYTLAATLGRSETTFTDDGTTFDRLLDTTVTTRDRARFDARLLIDPGAVIKLEGSRIEAEYGTQLIAEGTQDREIIFTSLLDDRYGAGGTFDTNDDGDLISALTVFFAENFEAGTFDPALWLTSETTASIDGNAFAETSGSLSAHLGAGDVMTTETLDLTGEQELQAQFFVQRTGGGTTPDGDLVLEYRQSDGTWTQINAEPGNADDTEFRLVTVDLPATAIHFTSAFRVRNIGGSGDWFVDDFRILEARTNSLPSAGNWGGLYIGHLSSASIDHSLLTFGGGVIPIDDDFAGFNVLEIHQAETRVRNTVFEENASGLGGTADPERAGLFENAEGTIFVRGAQPVIVDNEFRSNAGPVININANSLNSVQVNDPGRSTGAIDRDVDVLGNQGPLVDGNLLGDNDINGLLVRPVTLTTLSVWDDTDIVHVLQEDILVPDQHTQGGLRLESSGSASLVVKLDGPNAGFTANGYPLDIDDRIGGSLQIAGLPGLPVILTSISDDTAGAGFDLLGFPLRDTNNDGQSTGTAGDWRSVRISEFASDRNVRVYLEQEPASAVSPEINGRIDQAEVVGRLAPDVNSGDENLRLGYQIHGEIDTTADVDVFGFEATAGTHVWLDIDRTSSHLDTVIELLDGDGNILAQSDNSIAELDTLELFTTGTTNARSLDYSINSSDLWTLNPNDAGLRVTLPGAVGVTQSYFVRVRSSNLNASFQDDVLFSDNFESGTFAAGLWASTGGATIDGIGLNEPSGILSARINNDPTSDQLESVAVDLNGRGDVQLSYSFQRTGGGDSTENGEDLVFSYRNASGTWIELDRQLGAGVDMDTFERAIVDLPAAALHSNFALRVSTSSIQGGTTDDWFIDDIQIAELPEVNRNDLQSNDSVGEGLTTGSYQLQVRLGDTDEFPGSQVSFADIRFADNAIEIFGQPTHSLITGEASETTGVTVLPNVLNTDRAAISISGNLSSATGGEVDLYEFEVFYDVTQNIAGDDDGAHVPITFDLDYADGFSRANTTIAVFNSDNELILIGKDSNISDDQPKPLDGSDIDDISRGSIGEGDGFIGPVELPSGTYRLAVFANDQVPAALQQFYTANAAGTDLVRVEPINSVQRIAEERFYPTEFTIDPVTGEIIETDVSITTATAPITDLFTVGFDGTLDDQHIVPFNLGDVTLFVTSDGASKNGDLNIVQTVDPFTGQIETLLGGYNRIVGDVAIRADGQLHGLTIFNAGETNNPNNLTDAGIGNYLRIDTGTAAATQIGDDGIATNLFNNNASAAHNVGVQFHALAYSGTSNGNDTADLWAVGSRSTLGTKTGQQGFVAADYTTNVLYNLNLASGAVDGLGNNRTNVAQATNGAGTTQVEWGQIDTSFANGGLGGTITGMVTLDGGNSFFMVDDAGGLYLVNLFGFGGPSTTFLRNIGADENGVGGQNLNFQGLTVGPENVEDGRFASTLFAITETGEIFAFDTNGNLEPIFLNAATSINTGIFGVRGFDFGTLDYNLWHVTNLRGGLDAADDGHGVDTETFDNSVALPEPGGSSLYFGFEGGANTPDPSFDGNASAGNKNTNGNAISTAAPANNVDFPGGAHGSVVSNTFSLEGYDSADKPALYFSYFLETEQGDFDTGPNPDDLARDSFRVFVQDEGGQWRLVTTNNSFASDNEADEFDIGSNEIFSDGLSDNPSVQSFPDVVETFDNAGWRQAKVDLSNFAGMSDLRLRFDFATGGAMNVGDILTTGSELYAVPAGELTDGQTIVLSDFDASGFFTGTTTFEFDLGAHLTVPSGAAAIGQEFTIVGPGYGGTFTFTDAPVNPTDIPAFASDSAEELAQRTNDFLNSFFGGIRVQMANGFQLQNESFRFRGEIFTFTDNPTRATDILAEPGDTAATIATRVVNVVNSVLGDFSATSAGADVDFFRGSTIEFGGSLDINSSFLLEGESFTVLEQTFTFTDNPLIASDIDISDLPTTDVLAARAAGVIDSVFGAGTAFVFADAPTRLSVPNLPTAADGFFTGGTLFTSDIDPAANSFLNETFTVFGTTFVFTDTPTTANDILAEAGDSAEDIAARVRTAINGIFGPDTTLPANSSTPGRVSVPSLPNFTDAFQLGSSIVIQNVGDLEGYEFEIFGQSFRFTAVPSIVGDILARPTDDPLTVTAEAVRIINQQFGFGASFQVGTRIVIPNLSDPNFGVFQGSLLNFGSATTTNVEGDSFTVFGTTYTFTQDPNFFTGANVVDIDYSTATSADDLAQLAASNINAQLAFQGVAPRATVISTPPSELVGVDFDPTATSPNNWNHVADAGAGTFTVSDLIDELGAGTGIDLTVNYQGVTGLGTIASAITPGTEPVHTTALLNVDGAIADEAGISFTYNGLDAGAEYELYIFGGDTASSGSQTVTIFGETNTSFNQTWANSNLLNDQAMSANPLASFAVTARADAFGSLTVFVTEATAASDVVVPAIALQRLANASTVEIAGAVNSHLGSSIDILGPQANLNGDTISVFGIPFTYADNPANGFEIDTDANNLISAANTAATLNANFQNGFTNDPPAFTTNTRVSVPYDTDITSNDSGNDGSLIVSDHVLLEVVNSGSLLNDVLTYRGFDFTFTNDAAPAPGVIASGGDNDWSAADIVASINSIFGAESVVVNGNQVYFDSPNGVGPQAVYSGGGGLTVIDDGTRGNSFFFTSIAEPAGTLLEIDAPGSPMVVDQPSTTLTHDTSGSPLLLIPAGPAKVSDNRITLRSATSISTPGSVLETSGGAGTAAVTAGSTIQITSTAGTELLGDTIEIPNPLLPAATQIFTYVLGAPTSNTEIQVDDNPSLVASRTQTVVESFFGQSMFFTDLPNASLTLTTGGSIQYTDSAAGDGGISFPGLTSLPAISIDVTMDANEVAIAIRQALADVYSAGDINNIKGHEDLIQLIGHGILDDGPLTSVSALPGDEFGAFDTGFVNNQANRPGSLRGINNNVEGVYVDDIIIGFAERGEMVTNAPSNTGFITNPDVDRPDQADFNQAGLANENLDILTGVYDVEIRRASEVGLTADPFNLLERTLDTNDRETVGISVTVPSSIEVPDRTTFTVSNGINDVVFQFVDTRGSQLSPDPGNIRILFNPVEGLQGTGLDDQEILAQQIINAINSSAAQDALTPQGFTDAFGVQAVASDTDGTTSHKIHLTGNASFTPDPVLAGIFQITQFNNTGDSNRLREQGQITIENSFFTDSAGFGVVVDAGARDLLAHPGSVRTTLEVNTDRVTTGVVVSNNVIARNASGGIQYSGDQGTNPDGVAPVGRIINNTIYGDGTGIGVQINQGAAPTLLNNILADLTTGITVDAASSAVIGSTLYRNAPNQAGVGLGTFPIVLTAGDPLFIDEDNGNFYPAPGSQAIDSSLETLDQNSELVRVSEPLGIGRSQLLAPDIDVFGQVRGDDDDVSTPSAQGGNVFIDRGAIDRVDFPQTSPTAVLRNPEDGGATDLEPDDNVVWINIPETRREFRVRLLDIGIGIDDSKVNTQQFVLTQDGVELIDGVHYVWAYNSVNNDVIFTAVTAFDFERRYTITIANTPPAPGTNDVDGIQDLAGNYLAANQIDGTTRFDILVTDGVNDAPLHSIPTDRPSIFEGAALTFSVAGGNAITVSDADVHLAPDPMLQVTLSTSEGVLTLGSTTGLTFPIAGQEDGNPIVTIKGTVSDLNAALDGLRMIPPADYFNLLPGEDPLTNPDPLVITIQTNDAFDHDDDPNTPDIGQFAGIDSPVGITTDQILVDVISINDPPTFNTPVADPDATDEDTTGLISVPNFVTGMSPGPASESGQTVAFQIVSVTTTSGNIAFLQAPEIDPSGTLTYSIAPDSNGTADVVFRLFDEDASDPNHTPAFSLAETVTITVNPINDEPEFTLTQSTVNSNEDAGPVGPISLIATSAAGPSTATDELADQTLTFVADSVPVVTSGNLVFTSFSVSPTTGELTFETAPDTAGTATFQISVMDDGPTIHPLDDNQSAQRTVFIDIAAQPDPPIAVSPDYTIDEGESLTLDASGSSDPDSVFPGDTLTYEWHLDDDGIADATGVSPTLPYSALEAAGLVAPGVNTIRLDVTDTFSGTTVSTNANVTILTVDYGDADDSFGTLKASNGAAHTIVDGFFLGSSIDSEFDGQADDGADEDGIVFEAGLQADAALDIDAFLTATASAPGRLDIWIDLNGNNVFEASEHLNNGVSYDLVAGDNRIDFVFEAGTVTTATDVDVRARFSSIGGLSPIGRADDGEVEDYQITVSDLLDPAPVTQVTPRWEQTSDLTPLLSWEQAAGTPAGANQTYNVRLENALGQVIGFEEGLTVPQIELSNPLAAGTYRVVVTPFNKAGVAGTPQVLPSFTVVPIAIIAPQGSVLTSQPTIEWTPITERTDRYELEIRNATTGALVLTETNIPGNQTTFDVSNDLPLGDYQVRVRAIEAATGFAGDWSPLQEFSIETPSGIISPIGLINTATPLIEWTTIEGAATYDVRITDLTDTAPVINLTGLTGNIFQLDQPLDLGQYSFEVRGVTSLGSPGAWSTPRQVFVALQPVVSQPTGDFEDATPTIAWSAVPGAENYDITIRERTTQIITRTFSGITGTQFTVPNGDAIGLGLYEVVVTANNLPETGSVVGTASGSSVPTNFTMRTPPVVTAPAVGIYDRTPTIEFTTPVGTDSSFLEIRDSAGNIILQQDEIVGNSFTVTAPLPIGQYRVQVRSSNGAPAPNEVVSEFSAPHFFQIGSAPGQLGLAEGIGAEPFSRTIDSTPVLTWEGPFAGHTYDLWLTNVSDGVPVRIVQNLTEESYQLPELQNGQYRAWVRADNGLGENSSWSTAFDFVVVTAPTVAELAPTFDTPVIRWTNPANTPASEIVRTQLWINNLDTTPNSVFLIESNLTAEEYLAENEFPDGRYRVWTRVFVQGDATNIGEVASEWSNGVNFEVSGRPILEPIANTIDTTPVIRWSAVTGAVSYEVFVSSASAPSVPIERASNIGSTAYEVTVPLEPGDHLAWVRARNAAGEFSPWSLTSDAAFTIDAADRPVIQQLPASTDSTPTFVWTDVGAPRYEIFLAPASTPNDPLIRDSTLTTNTYTVPAALPTGSFRVWVRAISASDIPGPWSFPMTFTIVSEGTPEAAPPTVNDNLLASLPDAVELTSDLTTSLIPSHIVEDSGRQVPDVQFNLATGLMRAQKVSETSRSNTRTESAIDDNPELADTLMQQWTEELIADESMGAASSEDRNSNAVAEAAPPQPTAASLFSGLALIPSVLKRRKRKHLRKTDDE